MKKINNKGFSLVELIIVIAIMAVLIGVLAPQFIKYVERSRESTDLQNIEEVKTAVEAYVADNGENLSSNITVTGTKGGNISVANASVSEYGVTGSEKMKSNKWSGNIVWTYDVKAYTWSLSSNVSGDAFYADGSQVKK